MRSVLGIFLFLHSVHAIALPCSCRCAWLGVCCPLPCTACAALPFGALCFFRTAALCNSRLSLQCACECVTASPATHTHTHTHTVSPLSFFLSLLSFSESLFSVHSLLCPLLRSFVCSSLFSHKHAPTVHALSFTLTVTHRSFVRELIVSLTSPLWGCLAAHVRPPCHDTDQSQHPAHQLPFVIAAVLICGIWVGVLCVCHSFSPIFSNNKSVFQPMFLPAL